MRKSLYNDAIPSEIKFCPNCGTKRHGNFCTLCGTNLTGNKSQAPNTSNNLTQ